MDHTRFRTLGKISADKQAGVDLNSLRNRRFEGFQLSDSDDEPRGRGLRSKRPPERYTPPEEPSTVRPCRQDPIQPKLIITKEMLLKADLLKREDRDSSPVILRLPASLWPSYSDLDATNPKPHEPLNLITETQSAAIFRSHDAISNLRIDRCNNCGEIWFDIQSGKCDSCTKDPLPFGIESNPSSMPDLIRFALYNDIPPSFRNVLCAFETASLAEKTLISQVTLFLYIFKKRHVPGAGDFFKGSFIAFPEGHPALDPVLKLPRSAAPFITVRTSNEQSGSTGKTSFFDFRIRRQLVILMLEWLVYHSRNPLYYGKNDLIDSANLRQLPEDSCIETLVSNQLHDSSDLSILNDYTQGTPPNVASNHVEDDIPDCHLEQAERTRNQYSFVESKEPPNLVKEFPSILICKRKLTNPLPFWSPKILLGAFPYLFLSLNGLPLLDPPAGAQVEASLYPDRKFQLTFRSVIQHLLRLAYLSQTTRTLIYPFQSASFVAYSRQVLMAEAVNRNVRFFVRKNELGELTIPQLLQELSSPEKQSRIRNCISRSCESFSGSTSYWAQRKRELWEIARQTNSLNCFYTITIGDLHHPILLSLLGIPTDTPVKQRAEAISLAPGLVDAFFYKTTRILVKQFLSDIGFKIDYTRFEFQARGQAHAHGIGDFPPFRLEAELKSIVMGYLARSVLFVRSERFQPTSGEPQIPAELIDPLRSLSHSQLNSICQLAEKAEKDICTRIESYISGNNPLFCSAFEKLIQRRSFCSTDSNEIIPDEEYLQEIKELRESYLREVVAETDDDPLTTAINILLNRQLDGVVTSLIQRCMIHRCSTEYCRSNRSKACRFGHPLPLAKHSMVKVQFDQTGSPKISMTMASNDPWLHPYAAAFLAAVAANCDMTVILDRTSVLAYVVKYVSKAEPSDEFSLSKILRSIANPNLSCSPAVKSVVEKIVGEKYRTVASALASISRNMISSRVVSVQEAIHVILGTPLYNTSILFKRISPNLESTEIDLDRRMLKQSAWMNYAKRMQFQSGLLESNLVNMNADTFFRTLKTTWTQNAGKKLSVVTKPTIVLYSSSASMERPPEASSSYVGWIRWFFIRWVAWIDSPETYFLHRFRSKLSAQLLCEIEHTILDQVHIPCVSAFWRQILHLWTAESTENASLLDHVSVQRSVLSSVKEAARSLQELGNTFEDELGNLDPVVEKTNLQANLGFADHLSQDFDQEIPYLAPSSIDGVKQALFECPCLRQLLSENETEYYALAQAATGFWGHLKSSSEKPTGISGEQRISKDLSTSLSSEQRDVYEACLSMANTFLKHGAPPESSSRILLVLGAAGCGKSRIIDAVRAQLEAAVAITATTGTAAYNIRGQTVCSFAALYREKLEGEAEAELIERLEHVCLIIIDEASMLNTRHLIMIEERISVPIVLFGDFRQAPPVGGEPLWFHPDFSNWKKVLLEKVYRQTDPIFKSLLERIARGQMTRTAFQYLIDNASAAVHPSREAEFMAASIPHLSGTNEEVNSINEFSLLKAVSCLSDKCTVKIPVYRQNQPTSDSLYLCSDAPVILEKNLNVTWGMTNGTQGTAGPILYLVGQFPSVNQSACVLVKFLDRPNPGFLAWIRRFHGLLQDERYDCLSDYIPIPTEYFPAAAGTPACHKVPLKLNWAKTIHKSQAQTLDRVIIRIPKRESQNLTYVALSRVVSIDGLVLSNVQWLTEDRLIRDINQQTPRSILVEKIYQGLRPTHLGPPEYLSYLNDDHDQTSNLVADCSPKIPPLAFTPEESRLLTRVLSHPNGMGEILVSDFGIDFKQEDALRLRPEQFLNDETINFYFHLIQEQYKDVHIFSTYLMTLLSMKQNVSRWREKQNIFQFRMILVPVHDSSHWTLIVAKLSESIIEYYDSLPSKPKWSSHCELFTGYLQREELRYTQGHREWKSRRIENLPGQENGFDCGVFCCMYALSVAQERQIWIRQSMTSQIRQRMLLQILQRDLGNHLNFENG